MLRAAGGLATLGAGLDTAAFTLLQLSLLADRDPLVTVHELEAWALPAMDEHRVTKAVCMAERRVVETTESLRVVWDGAVLRRAEEHESAATVLVGPSAVGTFAMLKDLALAPGERLGHLNAALMRFLDAELGTGFGPVEAAPDVRAVLGETVT